MTPSNPATLADLQNLYQGDATPGAQQAWLDMTWRALLLEVPSIPDRLDTEPMLLDAAGDVVIQATLRILRNPDGLKQESGAIDDYQESWTNADASQDVYFTAAELRRLAPSADSEWSTGWAGSVRYC